MCEKGIGGGHLTSDGKAGIIAPPSHMPAPVLLHKGVFHETTRVTHPDHPAHPATSIIRLDLNVALDQFSPLFTLNGQGCLILL